MNPPKGITTLVDAVDVHPGQAGLRLLMVEGPSARPSSSRAGSRSHRFGTTISQYCGRVARGRNGVGPITLFMRPAMPCRLAAEVKDFDPRRK